MITLLIADDHLLFREGMRNIIAHWDDFQVVGEAANGLEAIQMSRELMPDIVLMDISMPVLNGIEATRRISRELPSVQIVILTSSEEEKNLFEAIKGGARGYVLKDTPSRRLHDSLRGVMHGESTLAGVMASKMLEEFNRPWKEQSSGAVIAYIEPLTERERQVLELVSKGLSNQLIAERLVLSENTIKKYLHNIMEKLHLNNRVEAAMYAVREGLVDKG
jgi:DNA-binding NarL/FixJ family response regulator